MSALVMPSLGMAQTASPDRSAYILTPEPAPEPRINGARVFGARPGSDFIFAIAATGDRPMTFSAEGLPKGLVLDPNRPYHGLREKSGGVHREVAGRERFGELRARPAHRYRR